MKAYLLTTAIAFALIDVAHVLRIIDEGVQVATTPVFLVTSLASLAMCAWAIALLRQLQRRSAPSDD